MADKLKANDRSLIERCMQKPVYFAYAPCPKGGTHTRLIRSAISPSMVKRLHALALDGYVCESWTGADNVCAPEHTLTYTVTALGRDAIDEHRKVKPMTNWVRSPTDAELLAESQGERS